MTCTRYDKNAKRVCGGKVRPSGRWVAGKVCEVCGAYQRDSARPWSRSGEQPTTAGEACNGCVDGHLQARVTRYPSGTRSSGERHAEHYAQPPDLWTPSQRTVANLRAMEVAASKRPEEMTAADREALAAYAATFDPPTALRLVRELRAARSEVERLRTGGCARDQRTTQFCAEAVGLRAKLSAALDPAD